MSEEQIALQTLQYITGELSPGEEIQFEAAMEEHPGLRSETENLRQVWQNLGLLNQGILQGAQPSPALRARFYQNLNAQVHAKYAAPQSPWWKRAFVPQMAAGFAIFLLGLGVGHFNGSRIAPPEVAQLQTQVEGLRQTVALSLMEKQSASSRLQGVEWSSQVDRPDQELLSALLTTLNHDQNINVRLASLDALEKFTADPGVRKALEQSIPSQQSPLLQIALIDALVHIGDNGAASEFKQLSGNTALNAAVRQRAQWAIEKLSIE